MVTMPSEPAGEPAKLEETPAAKIDDPTEQPRARRVLRFAGRALLCILKGYFVLSGILVLLVVGLYATYFSPDSDAKSYLNPAFSSVSYAYDEYCKHETPEKRGEKFAQLMGALYSLRCLSGYRIEQDRLVEMVGPPDLYLDDGKGRTKLVYFYDQQGKKDWAMHVFMESGALVQIGWNEASVNDYSRYGKWIPPQKKPEVKRPSDAEHKR
jgi:hypothetical protein